MRISPLKPLLLLPLISIASAADQQCYWPSGDKADGYYSCNQGASVSNCCNLDAVCLDNGFCMDSKSFGNRLKRGACTDSTWGPSCQQLCKDTFPGGQSSLILTGDFDPGTYCCGNIDFTSGKCGYASGGSNEPFRGPSNGAVIYNRLTGSTSPNITSSSSPTATVTVTNLNAGTAQPCPTAVGQDSSISCPADKTVAVGAGLGASLGSLVLILAGLLAWQVGKRKTAERKLNEMVVTRPALGYHQVGNGSGEMKGQQGGGGGAGGEGLDNRGGNIGRGGTVKHELPVTPASPAGGYYGGGGSKVEMRG